MRWIEQPGLLHVVTAADWSALGAGATPVAAKVLVAFAEWLKLGDAASLQGASLAQHPLLAAALEGLASESAFDEAVDATVELVLLHLLGGPAGAQHAPRSQHHCALSELPMQPHAHHASAMSVLALMLWEHNCRPSKAALLRCCRLHHWWLCLLREEQDCAQVMKQLPLFKRLLQEAASGNDESEDIAKGLARVFAEVGEAYVSLIAAGRPSYHHHSLDHGLNNLIPWTVP